MKMQKPVRDVYCIANRELWKGKKIKTCLCKLEDNVSDEVPVAQGSSILGKCYTKI